MNDNYYIHVNVLFKRACAFILDIFICFFIGVFLATIYTALTTIIIDKPNLNILLLILLVTNYLLLLFKDFILGNSLGKKTFRIVILDEQTSSFPTKKQLFLRNLFLFLSPVEMILPIFTGKRVGDYVSKTVVVDKRDIDKIRSEIATNIEKTDKQEEQMQSPLNINTVFTKNSLAFYQLISFIINQKSVYCIWYSDKNEGILCREKRIVSFTSAGEAKKYAFSQNINLDEETFVLNIDDLLCWVNSDNLELDCVAILNAWNMFIDIASSVESHFDGNERTKTIDDIYNKLYCGNNVLVDKEEDIYNPAWTKREVHTIKQVLKNGAEMLH